MAQIGIIGAGVTGLAAAWELQKQGHSVTILEAQAQPGGLAAGFKAEHWLWSVEKFYHHWFESDKDLLQLAEELGIRHNIIFPRPKTAFWYEGEVYQLDSPLTALKLPIISWWGKLRFGLTGLYLRFSRQWKWLEGYTADEWLRKTLGREVYEKLWRPLLIGKFGEFYKEATMAWFWARIHSRTTRLGTYRGGFQAFLEDVAVALRSAGVQIHLKSPVEQIKRQEDGGLYVQTPQGEQRFDAVISTTSPRLLLKLAPQLNGHYAEQVAALRSTGAVVMVLALSQQLMTDGTYWLSLPARSPERRENPFPFLALVEHTNYVDKANFGGDHIVYLGDYVPPDHEYFQMSDEKLAARFLPALQQVNPAFSADWIKAQWVFRAPYAQPLPTVNHSCHIPPLRSSLPGLYWASMSQVYPWDRGTNYAVEIGRRVARLLMDDLA